MIEIAGGIILAVIILAIIPYIFFGICYVLYLPFALIAKAWEGSVESYNELFPPKDHRKTKGYQ